MLLELNGGIHLFWIGKELSFIKGMQLFHAVIGKETLLMIIIYTRQNNYLLYFFLSGCRLKLIYHAIFKIK
ncbi:hypothetical protein SAMN03159289_00754 [Klebsiella quasipneumoniae]|nr:hypothetical protein SAMN03159418_00404 [Klebsiella quasipneumoniae]SFX06915.1 hypothetical protein SAMN03159364_00404 [Klebsiella quasipneumoniae]SFX25315.1 hypothetical protein SAMN03159289_00754 [Klebsiella quasipneumoniae]SMC61807.1 hypothetical protein SAMN03159480_1011278 [Klebsiella quasipneumoniae]